MEPYGSSPECEDEDIPGQRDPKPAVGSSEARERNLVARMDKVVHEKDTICGIDKRPWLPCSLITTLILGAACVLTVHRDVVRSAHGAGAELLLFVSACSLYMLTIGSMAIATYVDPGQLGDEPYEQWRDGTQPLPKRAHKTWHCPRPVLRFDHYCRWIKNCIGLRNHREFLLMTAGCATIALLGTLLDVYLLIRTIVLRWSGPPEGYLEDWPTNVGLLVHFVYSCIFGWQAMPILRLHVGFVSRNELAKEWRQDRFYVLPSPVKGGEPISVQELNAEEYNAHFESFRYDSKRNPFDKGWLCNCWAFWCTPRWAPGQLGEF